MLPTFVKSIIIMQDPNMRHESAPKPRLTDADYRKDYLSDKIGVQKRLEWTEQKYFVTTEEEPLFDAADVLRFGKDLSGATWIYN
jgi:glycine amidinotransferase